MPTKLENKSVGKVQSEVVKMGFVYKYWKEMYDQPKPLAPIKTALKNMQKYNVAPGGDFSRTAEKDLAGLIQALSKLRKAAAGVKASKQLVAVCQTFAKHVEKVEKEAIAHKEYLNQVAFQKGIKAKWKDQKFWLKHCPEKNVLDPLRDLARLKISKPADIEKLRSKAAAEACLHSLERLSNGISRLPGRPYREAASPVLKILGGYERDLSKAINNAYYG